ncbi:hypothetical protein NDU88_007817 [Pleurodeles waltl]|uniref:Uncharacterized protein n=1 Tax=Pleurodeles waltl TaxID=8319 RepID=A0AAV7VTF6_PLEWA|nr:hypothetical protein NDU88_007817 [Pleurodeles waltl]
MTEPQTFEPDETSQRLNIQIEKRGGQRGILRHFQGRLSSALTHPEGRRRWKRRRRRCFASEKRVVEKPARSLLLALEAVRIEELAARLPGSLPGQDKEVSHAQAPEELAWGAERS